MALIGDVRQALEKSKRLDKMENEAKWFLPALVRHL